MTFFSFLMLCKFHEMNWLVTESVLLCTYLPLVVGKHCSGSNFVVPVSLNASNFWTSAKNSKEVESQSKALPEKKVNLVYIMRMVRVIC